MSVHFYFIFSAIIIALVVGLFVVHKLSIPYCVFLLQVLTALIFESIGTYIGLLSKQNNTWVFNIYMLLEMVLLGIAGSLFLERSIRVYPLFVFGIMLILWMVNAFISDFDKLFNWFFVSSSALIIVLYVFILFKNLLFKKKRLFKEPLFYLCFSSILYFASVIPLFGLINYLIIDNITIATQLFYINISLVILRYTLIAIAFYLYGSQAKRGYVQQ